MYGQLYEAWKREREDVEIQKLPRDFYAKLADYVKKMREESRMLDEKTTKARLMKREFENVKRVIDELVQLRCDKTFQTTGTGKIVPRENLTEEEEKFHGEFSSLAESYQGLLKDILRGRLSRAGVERKEKPKKVLVRFLQEIPAIIGSDMKTYGPFKPENLATLPVENARILIKQGAAVEVEAKN